MKSSKKRGFWGFTPFDTDAACEYLSKKAANGLMIEAINGWTAVYSVCEPQSVSFTADIFTGAHSEHNAAEKLKDYKKRWSEKGYTLRASNDFIYFFSGGTDDAPFTDCAEKINMTQKAVWRREFYCISFLTAMLVFGAVSLWQISYEKLLSCTGICSVAVFPLFLIPAVLGMIIMYCRYKKGCLLIRRGAALPRVSLKTAQRRYRTVYVTLLTAFIFIVFSFAADGVLKLAAKFSGGEPAYVCTLSRAGVATDNFQSDFAESSSYIVPTHYKYVESTELHTVRSEIFICSFTAAAKYMYRDISSRIGDGGTSVAIGDEAVYFAADNSILIRDGEKLFYYKIEVSDTNIELPNIYSIYSQY